MASFELIFHDNYSAFALSSCFASLPGRVSPSAPFSRVPLSCPLTFFPNDTPTSSSPSFLLVFVGKTMNGQSSTDSYQAPAQDTKP